MALVFGVWGGGLALYLVPRLTGATWSANDALALFPVLILSVALAGLLMTGLTSGRAGLRISGHERASGRLAPSPS